MLGKSWKMVGNVLKMVQIDVKMVRKSKNRSKKSFNLWKLLPTFWKIALSISHSIIGEKKLIKFIINRSIEISKIKRTGFEQKKTKNYIIFEQIF